MKGVKQLRDVHEDFDGYGVSAMKKKKNRVLLHQQKDDLDGVTIPTPTLQRIIHVSFRCHDGPHTYIALHMKNIIQLSSCQDFCES